MLIELDHPRLRRVERQVFLVTFAPDCMTHDCRCLEEGGRPLEDACCQYGADLDLGERDAIRARATEVAAVLAPERRDPAGWFDASEAEEDPDFPSGVVIRTAVARPGVENGGCVFLEHDARGCGLHRAALAHGFDPAEIKPAVCRLYPLAYGDGVLGLSDDFADYSCAGEGGPTVYRLMRTTVGEVFGPAAIAALDRAEANLLRRRLPLQVMRSHG